MFIDIMENILVNTVQTLISRETPACVSFGARS